VKATRPTVSVVVCFLNEERFLGEAVRSVKAQTLTDWELILVDDGSGDGSSALARHWAAQDPDRVFCIEHAQHANLGLSASRNVGISRARGRFIAFLDADDVWYPRKLEEQVAILERYPQAAMVVGASQYWRSWASEASRADEVVSVGTTLDAVAEPPRLMLDLYPLGSGAAPPPSDLLLRAETVREVGGFEASFRGPLMLYEDQAFLSKIYRRYPVYVASTCWDRYRERTGSIVAANLSAGRYWRVRTHFLRWLRNDLSRTGPSVPAVDAAVTLALRQARMQALRARVAAAASRLVPTSLRARMRQLWPAVG
jgi:glycosyltransferase involved in cell wall biosynthesis